MDTSPPASRHIFDDIPPRTPPRVRGQPNPDGRKPALRFDEVCSRSVSSAQISALLDTNTTNDVFARGWRETTTKPLLKCIDETMRDFPAERVGSVQALTRFKHVELFVGLVEDVEEKPAKSNVITVATPVAGLGCHHVRVLCASSDKCEKLLLRADRWKVAKRKFSTPNQGHVRGPYLVVAALDPVSRQTIRARLWPVAISPDASHFKIVRSGPERAVAEALWEMGVTAFAPLRLSDLHRLQDARGGCWEGDLSMYDYLPDVIILPSFGCLVGLMEIFGLCSFRRYEIAQAPKMEMLRLGHELRAFIAYQIFATKRTKHEVDREVRAKLRQLMPLRGVAFPRT